MEVKKKVSHLGLLNLSDFIFFFGFRVGANDILSIELNFLSIYKGNFRTFFPNGEKKTKSQTASQLFFQKLFFSLLDAVRMIFSV